MKTSLSLILLLTATTAFAQVRKSPPTVKPPGSSRVPAGASTAGRVAARTAKRTAPDGPGLTSNVTLAFKGALPGSGKIDLELTGNGPRFTTDLVGPRGDDPSLPVSIITLDASVAEDDGKYVVEYRVGARIAVTTSTMQGGAGNLSRNIQYRDILTTGSVIAEAGQSVAICKANGKTLTLTLSLAK